MALSTEQLLLLNNFLYTQAAKDTNNTYMSLGDIIQASDGSLDGADSRVIDMIRNDPTLCNLEIQAMSCVEGGETNLLFVDPSTNEATVAFAGTGANEWKDNFIGGTVQSNGDVLTPIQQSTLDWSNTLNLDSYDGVTVTGHSKGGNKAKVLALLNGDVDNCVSFDGQGFSDEFCEQYADEIAQNQSKIQNHNAEQDYVNILLNDVGERHYYTGHNQNGDFLQNHHPAAFFDFENGGVMTQTEQDPTMVMLDDMLNGYLRSMPQGDRQEALEICGELASIFLGNCDGDKMDAVTKLLLNKDTQESASYLMAYVLTYMDKNPESYKLFKGFLENDLDAGSVGIFIDIGKYVLTNEWLSGIFDKLAKIGAIVPDWLIGIVANLFDVDEEEMRKYLDLLVAALSVEADSYEQFADGIALHDGSDIAISSAYSGPISMDTQLLRAIGTELNELIATLEAASAPLNECAGVCETHCAKLMGIALPRLSLGKALRTGVGAITIGPSLRNYAKLARSLSEDVETLKQQIHEAADIHEECEQRLSSRVHTTNVF